VRGFASGETQSLGLPHVLWTRCPAQPRHSALMKNWVRKDWCCAMRCVRLCSAGRLSDQWGRRARQQAANPDQLKSVCLSCSYDTRRAEWRGVYTPSVYFSHRGSPRSAWISLVCMKAWGSGQTGIASLCIQITTTTKRNMLCTLVTSIIYSARPKDPSYDVSGGEGTYGN